MNACKTCKFSKIGDVNQTGGFEEARVELHCRRHAPQMLSGSGTGWSNQLFPIVKEDDWCGEYKQKDASK